LGGVLKVMKRLYGIVKMASGWPNRIVPAVVLFCMGWPALAAGGTEAYLIRVDGMITEAYAEAVERKVEFAARQGVKTVILELDTPGGTVSASMELGDFIFKQVSEGMHIVAYINDKAYSGGTMVALACEEIYIDAAVGMMGDVAPIGFTGQEAGEKFQAPIRKTMENYGAARGYPVALIDAMVTKEIEVFRIKTQDDPEPRFVSGMELDAMTEEERAAIVEKKLIVAAGQLLTLSASDAVQYGFARKAVASRLELYDVLQLEGSQVERLYLTGSEKILTVLDALSPLLIVAGVILFFIELSHPGFGLPGILGIACFATLFVVKYTLHYARLFEILLFVVGLALILIELFVTPGFGLMGGAGVLLLFTSLVLVFQQFTVPHTPSESGAFQINIVKVIGSLTAAAVGIAVLARFLPSLPILGRIIHTGDLSAATVGAAAEEREPGLQEMRGQVGVALTALRPAGRAEFPAPAGRSERQLDVVTEGDFIEKGTRVEIAAVHGSRVVVKPYREA